MDKKERIAKVIARAGICSRREAEKLILEGLVKVDGTTIDKPSINVSSSQEIIVNGKKLPKASASKLWIFHKPKGYITSHKDPQDRPTVFEILPPELPRVISVGRLDFNTEGLLLLTNDGNISRLLELPSTGLTRTYKVRAYGKLSNSKLDMLRKGVTISNINYAPSIIDVEKTQGDNIWLKMSITEGKNREIRRMLEFINLQVNRLIRIEYGPFKLGDLKTGQVKTTTLELLKEYI